MRLSALTATQERPIFSASRRPLPRVVAAMPVEEVAAPSPKSAETLPPLVLLGAVVGEGDAIAILLDSTDQKVIHLRQGESRAGWSLSSVQSREVTIKQGDRSEVLALQRPDTPAAAPAVRGLAGVPPGTAGGLTMPAAGNTSFAPFIPFDAEERRIRRSLIRDRAGHLLPIFLQAGRPSYASKGALPERRWLRSPCSV